MDTMERKLIKKLKSKNLSQAQICKKVKKFEINKMFISRTLKRLAETGDIGYHRRGGRRRSFRIKQL